LSSRERSYAGEKQAALRRAAHCNVPPVLWQSSVPQHCEGRKHCKGNTAAKAVREVRMCAAWLQSQSMGSNSFMSQGTW